MRNIYNVSLLDILPSNIASDEVAKAIASAIDKQLKKIADKIPLLTLDYKIDSLTSEWVDVLANQYRVDSYDTSLTLDQKTELVKNSRSIKSRKGTPSAIEELATTIFGDGYVEEWYEYGGDPFHFRVLTSNPQATNEKVYEFLRLINSVKRATAVLDSVNISSSVSMPLYFGFALHTGDTMTVRQVV